MTRTCWYPAIAVMAAAAGAPMAAADTPAAGGSYHYAVDSESFNNRRISVDAVARFHHLDGKTGVRYIDHSYARGNWQRSGEQLRFFTHQIDRRTADGWMLETGMLRQAEHSLWTLDASYRKTLAGGTALEAFANRDSVETRNALELGTYFNFVGGAVDQPLNPHLTAVGLLGHQGYSDGNSRRHARARLIYQPSLDLGLTLQLRYRYFDNSKDDVGSAYFNPKRYDESMLAAGWRQRAGDWRTAVTAGVGVQRIAGDDSSNTRLLEASAERQMSGYALRLRAGYSRAAAAAASDPAYAYRYATGEVLFPF